MTAPYALAFDSLEAAGPVVVCAVVLGFVFAECAFLVGLFLPGDSLLITAGATLSQDVGQLFVWALRA